MNAVLSYSRVQHRSMAKRDTMYNTPYQKVVASFKAMFADVSNSDAIVVENSDATYTSSILETRIPTTKVI